MAQKQVREMTPTPFLIISLVGLFLLALIAFYPPMVIGNFGWRKPLVGSILGIECFLGVLAAIYPKRCSRVFGAKSEKLEISLKHNLKKRKLSIRGHHPDCGNYYAHVFQIGGKYFCAGCTGLVLGAVVTLVGTILYFFGDLSCESNHFIFLSGCVGISLGLLQFHIFDFQMSFMRLLMNAFFVIGTFLALMGIDGIAQNTFVDLFLIGLSFFWIYTRIILSNWNHRKICLSCDMDSCEYKRARR
ncbi:MAG: hypothetical protein OEZ25_03460 [Candidatus Bathyarchaeota archaeon]|nr:hypothetical protein [Candidatus Bathyarchaeota archaeon]